MIGTLQPRNYLLFLLGVPESVLTEQSNFATLMQAITGCQSSLSSLTTKIDTVQLEIDLIRQDFEKVRQRVTEVERQVGDMEDMVRDHSASLHTLQVQVKHLESRAEDVEDRNRRNNLRIIGLSEGSKGSNPSDYTERLLRSLFSRAAFSSFFAMERAHRMPQLAAPLVLHLVRLSSRYLTSGTMT